MYTKYECRDKIAGSDFGQHRSVGPKGRGQDARVTDRMSVSGEAR